jgi:hypothetical protein
MRVGDAAHRVRLLPPRVGEHVVEFEWEVAPATELYNTTGFRLTFPAEVDLVAVPQALWLRLAMICLHPHWALLRPCRVELPFYLGPRERAFWERLTSTVAVQLVAYGAESRRGRPVAIHDDGPALPPVTGTANGVRAAAAFSGGKDSLTQAGLLAELTDRPLLITTTSPVPWAHDHTGAARRRTLSEITRRLPVDLLEVRSDFRQCWDNGYSGAHGCSLTVNELTDVLLYQATTIAAAAGSGINHSFMASEADLQYNTSDHGEVIQHGHFASSAATHAALDVLLRRFGLRLGSLTYPLHTDQVTAILWQRYAGVADLQFSCWSAADGAQACSTCQQCLEVALLLLGEGVSPRRAGIDPARVLSAWAASRPDAHQARGPRLHPHRLPRDKNVRIVQGMDSARVDAILAADPRREEAVAAYSRLHDRLAGDSAPPHPGYVRAFLDLVDGDLRKGLEAIFADQSLTPSSDPELDAMCRRSRSLAQWIADPLTR